MDPNWPIPSLEDGSYVQLDYWLARFIMEIRKEDQLHYTPGRPSLFILAQNSGMKCSINSPDINCTWVNMLNFCAWNIYSISMNKPLFNIYLL